MSRRAPSDSSARIATRKVPELTVVFWVTKALINGSSEWWPDYALAGTGADRALTMPGWDV
jgi:hypothetical protein